MIFWCIAFWFLNSDPILSQNLAPLKTLVGNYDYLAIGATNNAKDSCNYRVSSQAKLLLPEGVKIEAAYLYWSGSSQPGKTSPYIDDDVKLNNKKIVAEKTWTESRRAENKILHYYSAFADVTSLIHKSGMITVSDLWWNNSFACQFDAAYGGWSLFVIFEHPANPYRILKFYEGLEYIGENFHVLYRLDDFQIPACDAFPRVSVLSWDADGQIQDELYIDDLLVAEDVFGQENNEFSFDVVELPNGVYNPNALIKLNKNSADNFITQLLIVDHFVCNDYCHLSIPADTIINCSDEVDLNNLGVATADCEVNISYVDLILNTCPRTIERTWIGQPISIEDHAISIYRKQNIIINDDQPPSIEVCDDLDADFNCSDDWTRELRNWNNRNLQNIRSCAVDACGLVEVTSDFDLDNLIADCGGAGTLKVKYSVCDQCGNCTELTALATIIDQDKPVVLCKDIEYQLLAMDSLFIEGNVVDNGSFDDCSSIQELIIIGPDNGSLDCGNAVKAQLVGIDACGLSDTCSFEIRPMCFDLALFKRIKNTSDVSIGDTVEFQIGIINQGNITAKNIVIADHLPKEMSIVSDHWMLDSTFFSFQIESELQGGDTIIVELLAKMDQTNLEDPIVNYAEIFSAEAEDGFLPKDIDSDYDGNPFNDNVVDDALFNEEGDEDDHDLENIVVEINCSLTIDEPIISQPTCPGASDGQVDISVFGVEAPYMFTWDHGAETEDLVDIRSGTYRLLVTDALGCSVDLEVTVDDPSGISCTLQIESDYFGYGVSQIGAEDGRISVQIEGGTQPLVIQWDHGATDSVLTGLSAGVYTVIVTDAEGCTCSSTIELKEPEPLVCGIGQLQGISCPGSQDARLSAEPRGGIGHYQYFWSTGDTTQVIENLRVGQYTLLITDDAGDSCVSTFEVAPVIPIQAMAASELENCIDRDGSINLEVSGGTPPYLFQWNSGDTTQSLQNIGSGDYEVTITDANGCIFILKESVEQIECAGVGDFVWHDFNQNGIQDEDENGVNGITVVIREALTQKILDSVVTHTNPGTKTDGYYFFQNIPEGIYQIIFLKDKTFEFTIANGGDPRIDSDADPRSGVSFSFQVEPGELLETIDAGLILYSLIGDYVWLDDNKNDIQDIEENGLPDVKIYLLDEENNLLDSTVSDDAGYYVFSPLQDGLYRIRPEIPVEVDGQMVEFANRAQGADPAIDSDINPETGSSHIIEISGSTQLEDIDIGFRTLIPAFEIRIHPQRELSLYPNPTSHYFNLRMEVMDWEKEVQVEILNNRGQILRSQHIFPRYSTTLNTKFNIENLTGGIYYLKIKTIDRIQIVPFEVVN